MSDERFLLHTNLSGIDQSTATAELSTQKEFNKSGNIFFYVTES
ncbi:hypothetical protein [Photobacterium sanguinicancri]